jgi:hypothetical protein
MDRIIGCPKCYVVFLYFAPPEEHPDWQGEPDEGWTSLSEASVAGDERPPERLQGTGAGVLHRRRPRSGRRGL